MTSRSETRQPSDATRSRDHPVLAITMGDRNGVGPEIILKMLSELKNSNSGVNFGMLLLASRDAMLFYSKLSNRLTEPNLFSGEQDVRFWIYSGEHAFPSNMSDLTPPDPGKVLLVPCREPQEKISPGAITAASGKLAMDAVSAGVNACLSGLADAVVTAPISKESIHMAGFKVPGHTEYLAELTRTDAIGMMLVNRFMRIGLATIHLPLCQVSRTLTTDLILSRLHLYHRALREDFGIANPRIAVLGLNPHAGDGGVLGSEERELITPAIEAAKKQKMNIDGPWPADGFFGSREFEHADLVFAMYHDQGLIPLKLAGFGSGVNVTAGLPIIRTSPDHGTAFSIAGKNQAHAGSMLAACDLALEMIERRNISH